MGGTRAGKRGAQSPCQGIIRLHLLDFLSFFIRSLTSISVSARIHLEDVNINANAAGRLVSSE